MTPRADTLSPARVLLGALLLTCLLAGAHAWARKRTPLFGFGDSIVDTGNNNFLNTTNVAISPPYAYGRFSNGWLITDYLARYLRVRSPPPSLSNPRNLAWGVNFASAGSGVLDTTNPNKSVPLSQQLASFNSLLASGRLSPETVKKGVFLVHVGNDLNFLPTNASLIPAYLGTVVRSYVTFLNTLRLAGARTFVLINVGPVGCLPQVRAVATNTSIFECNAAFNAVTATYNSLVNSTLYSSGFMAAANVVMYDQFGDALRILRNLPASGLESPNACCGAPPPVNGLVKCGTSAVINGVTLTYTVCRRPNKYLFWDGIHPTTSQNRIFTDAIWSGSAFVSPASGLQSLLPK